jgi:hypothetical protein
LVSYFLKYCLNNSDDCIKEHFIELRDKEFEKKFMYEKESMVGDKPKTV